MQEVASEPQSHIDYWRVELAKAVEEDGTVEIDRPEL